jgi:hypothetical protein
MGMLDPTPTEKVMANIDREKFTVRKDIGAVVPESYLVTHDESGVRVRVQPTEGEPDNLNYCGADTDADDWAGLDPDPATAAYEIERFAEHLAGKKREQEVAEEAEEG